MDWHNPDYVGIFKDRVDKLSRIRANPDCLPALRAFYRDHPAQFISDWGVTFDPRNVERGLPSIIPFVLFPRQVEYIGWVIANWKKQQSCVAEKTRDMGLSWISIALACTLCLHNDGVVIGFGSRKEEYVDRIGFPRSLFWKGRLFLQYLPEEFRGGWNMDKDSPHMRINFESTGSYICGEAGDNIGRGDRTSMYFVDEHAHIERPELVAAALSQTTNCEIDISTPAGMNNLFAQRVHSGLWPVFTFHWRDDPRKDDDWYERQRKELDPVTLAQEIDINYSASVEGIIIKPEWVTAAIDAHKKLGFEPTGEKRGALDVADGGKDLCAFCASHGVVVTHVEAWSGKESDIYRTTERAFDLCQEHGLDGFDFDSDGLGAGVRGDAREINLARKLQLRVEPFRGSGSVVKSEGEMVTGRKNKDMFSNAKAQAWWALRMRFERTYQAVTDGMKFSPDDMISISSTIPADTMRTLTHELSQPTYSFSAIGKMQVDKAPNGAKSPDLADSVMIRFAPSDHIDYSKLI